MIELAFWGKIEMNPKLLTVLLKGLITLKVGLATIMTPFGIKPEDSSLSVYWHSVSFKPITGISMPGAPMVYRYSASRVGMF